MPNIKFNYFYRDASNYKKFGFVIFDNPSNIDLPILATLIQSKLIDETYFYADEWNLPELFPETWHWRVDPTWHEFESLEFTGEPAQFEYLLEDFRRTLLSHPTAH
jgi:hypothetical protein